MTELERHHRKTIDRLINEKHLLTLEVERLRSFLDHVASEQNWEHAWQNEMIDFEQAKAEEGK